MGKKKKELSQVKKLFVGIKKKIRGAKVEAKRIQADCPHKSRNGKLWIKKYKKSGKVGAFRCKECDDVMYFGDIINKSPKEIKAYGKQVCNDFINYCNICKITLNPKYDTKYSKAIGKAQFGAYQVKKIGRIALGEVSGKNGRRRHKGGKKGNFIINGGSSGLR